MNFKIPRCVGPFGDNFLSVVPGSFRACGRFQAYAGRLRNSFQRSCLILSDTSSIFDVATYRSASINPSSSFRSKTMKALLLPLVFIFAPLFFSPGLASATSDPEEIEREATVEEHLNEQVDLSLPFINTKGERTTLGELLLPGRPAILIPVYYDCPSLCTFALNALLKLLNEIPANLGSEFSVISYSINPEEDYTLAEPKAAAYHEELKVGQRSAWHFLADTENSAAKLSKQIGFGYKKDGSEYIHAAVFVILTPEGKISRYVYGIDYLPRDVRLSLIEAAEGKFGSAVDKLLLYCFRWDHTQGKYSLIVFNVVKAVSLLTVVVLFGFLIYLRTQEIREKRSHV